MKIILDGRQYHIPNGFSVSDLLLRINDKKTVAVIINGYKLKYMEYDITKIKENDSIRILRPLGGG